MKPVSAKRCALIHSIAYVLPVLSFLAAPVPSRAAVLDGTNVVIAYGGDAGPHARVTFSKNRAASQALKIETFLAGVAGSKLSIFVDADPTPVFVHTLTDGECIFENEKSHCTITLPGRVAAYGRLLRGFRVGRVGRLQVETGGVMAMSHTSGLAGFTRATARIDG